MFDISWGEICVVGAVGVALTGRRDLPAACRFAGTQIGRLVGLLQGARARADQFAQQNELRQLQNELRSGLRELDQVKMELAVAASSRGVIGRSLGSTTPSANRLVRSGPSDGGLPSAAPPGQATAVRSPLLPPPVTAAGRGSAGMGDFDLRVVHENQSQWAQPPSHQEHTPLVNSNLPPAMQTERAAMEEEWEKQGIGFKAQAERGTWEKSHRQSGGGGWDTSRATGSELLEHLERQCLIFDQYDRVVAEKDDAVQKRMERMIQKKGEKDANT